ncbi:MAG: LysE family transporter [Prevotella sp.]|nr:LysE family transporter [Candidatus Prevotella equi]
MPFDLTFNFLDIIVKGMMIGIICSAPMGPVGVLCVQRTLNKGRWYGFMTGIGATLSDFIYALIAGFGMTFVMEFIDNPQYKFLLQISGSILLFCFGIYCFKSDPRNKVHASKNQKGTLVHNFFTAFLVTFSNPLIILLLLATFAQFAFIIPDHPWEMSLGYISIIAGALLWWYGLTWLIDKLRAIASIDGIVIINRIIGTIVMVFSFAILIGTAFNLFSIY